MCICMYVYTSEVLSLDSDRPRWLSPLLDDRDVVMQLALSNYFFTSLSTDCRSRCNRAT